MMRKYLPFLLLFLAAPALAQDELQTQAAFINRDIRDAHDTLTNQRRYLAAIQEGYLSKDPEAVQRNVNALERNLRPIERLMPDASDPDYASWAPFQQTLLDARGMKEAVDKNDFTGAYDRYVMVTGQCVRCHQLSNPEFVAPEPEQTEIFTDQL